MKPFRVTGPTVVLTASTTVGQTAPASVAGASHLLLSNKTATWAQFSVNDTSAVPVDRTSTGGYVPVAPGSQLVIISPDLRPSTWWSMFPDATATGRFEITPVEVPGI